MSENHKLRSVYFLATPKQVDQLIEHGYSIIRNVKHKVYEARVTDQQQFIRIAEEFDVHTTMSEDCLLYTSPSPRDRTRSRMPSSA